MSWIVATLVVLGGLVACLNFYLSFLAAPIHRLRHGRSPDRFVSGLPLVGSLLLLVGVLLTSSTPAIIVALVLLAIDTGGPHWFLGVMVWQKYRDNKTRG